MSKITSISGMNSLRLEDVFAGGRVGVHASTGGKPEQFVGVFNAKQLRKALKSYLAEEAA